MERDDEGSGEGLSSYYAESSEPILGASSPCVGREISPRASGRATGPTHDLARTLLPLDLRGHYFISQGALAHH